jgi:penicillin-binding protein 2
VIDVTPRDRRRFKKLQEESKNFESLPIRTRLTEEEVARFAVNRFRFPGFEIKARLFRSYPQGEVASHAIGYIGRINDADVKRIERPGSPPTTRAPTTSASWASRALREGAARHHRLEQVEIDAGGRAIRALARNEPSSGNNLVSTLDLKLQKVAEEAFQGLSWRAVALDPKTGEVLRARVEARIRSQPLRRRHRPQSWDALQQLARQAAQQPRACAASTPRAPPSSRSWPRRARVQERSPSFRSPIPGFFTLAGVRTATATGRRTATAR